MRAGDLSLTVSQRKLACVLDPALLLGHAQGPALALRLTQVFEPWLTRSFWQTLDASELLLRRIERGLVAEATFRPDADALLGWITLRDNTDAGSWTLRWVDENYTQSQVRDAADTDIVDRYEQLAAALGSCGAPSEPPCGPGLDPVTDAMDAVALSACLEGALLLSERTAGGDGDPWPVQALARACVPTHRLDPPPEHTLFRVERDLVRDALVSAGLVTLAQCLPPLAAVHVIVDTTADAQRNPWETARAWWYPL